MNLYAICKYCPLVFLAYYWLTLENLEFAFGFPVSFVCLVSFALNANSCWQIKQIVCHDDIWFMVL